jgi:uroporphyrinogen III methyltransferase/synthase
VAEALLAEHPAHILIARALEARHVLEERLAAAGVNTEVLPVYETVADETGIEHVLDELRAGKLQAITFTSARTFEAFAEACVEPTASLLANCGVAVIGPVTRAALEGKGIQVAAEAKSADMTALADALVEWRGSSL